MYQITDCFQPGTTIYRHGCGVKKRCIQVNSARRKKNHEIIRNSHKEITLSQLGCIGPYQFWHPLNRTFQHQIIVWILCLSFFLLLLLSLWSFQTITSICFWINLQHCRLNGCWIKFTDSLNKVEQPGQVGNTFYFWGQNWNLMVSGGPRTVAVVVLDPHPSHIYYLWHLGRGLILKADIVGYKQINWTIFHYND